MDVFYYMNDDGDKIFDIFVDCYMGWCKVLDFIDKKLGDHFSVDDLVKCGVTDGDRILLYIVWDCYFDLFDEMYFNMDYLYFFEEVIFWVFEYKLQIVGMDVLLTDLYFVDYLKIF